MSRVSSTAVGQIKLHALHEGSNVFSADMFPNSSEDEISSILADQGAEGIATNFNAFVVQNGSDTLLIDAGPGTLFGPACGFLSESLSELSLSPKDITKVFVTHIHPDHVGGMLDQNNEAVFPNASVEMTSVELDFWRNSTFTSDMFIHWQEVANKLFAAYGDRIAPAASSGDIISGVHILELPGHTPGHAGVMISDGNHQIAHVCDIFHAQVLQLANPDISIVFDADADVARQTRKATLDMLATDKLSFTGAHMLEPKFAKVKASGSGYMLVNE